MWLGFYYGGHFKFLIINTLEISILYGEMLLRVYQVKF